MSNTDVLQLKEQIGVKDWREQKFRVLYFAKIPLFESIAPKIYFLKKMNEKLKTKKVWILKYHLKMS